MAVVISHHRQQYLSLNALAFVCLFVLNNISLFFFFCFFFLCSLAQYVQCEYLLK
jgi:hypothetical protein